MFSRAWSRLYVFAFDFTTQSQQNFFICMCFSSLHSEGRTTINIIDPAFESKIRAKVADVFPFMKDADVSEHYKMIEQVLEDEKMVN